MCEFCQNRKGNENKLTSQRNSQGGHVLKLRLKRRDVASPPNPFCIVSFINSKHSAVCRFSALGDSAAHPGAAIGKWEALLGGRTQNQCPQENEDLGEEAMNFTA